MPRVCFENATQFICISSHINYVYCDSLEDHSHALIGFGKFNPPTRIEEVKEIAISIMTADDAWINLKANKRLPDDRGNGLTACPGNYLKMRRSDAVCGCGCLCVYCVCLGVFVCVSFKSDWMMWEGREAACVSLPSFPTSVNPTFFVISLRWR